MASHLPEYELYAIRYAERDARRSDHFIGGDPHDGPMPMDYFVWAAIGRDRSFVVDTGHEATPKPEPAGHRVIVDLVLGFLGGVEGLDTIGA